MLMTVLGLSIAVSALLAICAAYGQRRRWYFLFKPLTTLLILFTALMAALTWALTEWNAYASWVMAGLAFSLAGDVFLMLSDKRFVWGLVSFLVAHVCYIAAFTGRVRPGEPLWLSLPFLAAAVIIAVQRARRLRWPVTVYTVVLMVMVWRACAVWAVADNRQGLLAGVGAILFAISDTILAVNHFVVRFRPAQAIILSTYYAAQTLIAWSTLPAP
jgi:uncharacterized membrane protein YhhN